MNDATLYHVMRWNVAFWDTVGVSFTHKLYANETLNNETPF